MAAIPIPPGSRRSPVRPGEAAWLVAPGAAARRPRQPIKLKASGKAWWLAAWESPVSSLWEASEIRQVVRAARLADICVGSNVKAAHLVELRRLEDALALTRAGRLKLRIALPGERTAHGTPTSAAAEGAIDMQPHRERRRQLEDRAGGTA
jgi:hypothetical protein